MCIPIQTPSHGHIFCIFACCPTSSELGFRIECWRRIDSEERKVIRHQLLLLITLSEMQQLSCSPVSLFTHKSFFCLFLGNGAVAEPLLHAWSNKKQKKGWDVSLYSQNPTLVGDTFLIHEWYNVPKVYPLYATLEGRTFMIWNVNQWGVIFLKIRYTQEILEHFPNKSVSG